MNQTQPKAQELGSPKVIVICADVSKEEECKQFVDETVNHFGWCKCIMCFCFGLICCRQTILHGFIHTQKQLKWRLDKLWNKMIFLTGLCNSGSFGEQRRNNKSRPFWRFNWHCFHYANNTNMSCPLSVTILDYSEEEK